MSSVIRCLVDHHDLRLVLLAALICLLTSFTASAVLSRALASNGRQKLLWVIVAAVEFGCGVWSLHFVAMLAFMPGMPVSYELTDTVWSVVIAVLGSLCGFLLAVSSRRGPVGMVGAAASLTLAIGGMHYTGIAAMRLDGSFLLDPAVVACSVGLCAAFCVAAVISMVRLTTVARQILTAVMLSAAICTLHFVGMSAMDIRAGMVASMSGAVLASNALALVVAASSIALVLLSFALSIMDRLLCDRASDEKARLRKLAAVSFEGLIIERAGIIVDANDRTSEFSGYALTDIIGKPVSALFAVPDTPDGGANTWWLAGGDQTLRQACGALMPVELLAQPIVFDHNASTAIAIRDLTARRESEAALHRLAHHDMLTGLANRLLLNTRMRQAFEGTQPPRTTRGGVVPRS